MKRSNGQMVKWLRGEEVRRFVPLAFLPFILLAFLGCSERLSKPITAEQVRKAEETARTLATLFASGRAVIEHYQALINDPDKGYKHFTPEIFVNKTIDHFVKNTGIKLPLQACPMEDQDEVMDILMLYLESSKKAIADAQGLINLDGEGYKGFIAAVYGKETSRDFLKKCGIKIKQTTLRYRNPNNAPDRFEAKMLKTFLNHSYTEVEGHGEIVSQEGEPYYRYMLPIYVEKKCLKCHGESNGKADPTGHMKEGYKVGEARWAISVSVPL